MKDASFRMTRNREGKSTGYSDNDRGGLGSSAQKFEPIFVEYSAPSGFANNPYAKKPEPKPGMLKFNSYADGWSMLRAQALKQILWEAGSQKFHFHTYS